MAHFARQISRAAARRAVTWGPRPDKAAQHSEVPMIEFRRPNVILAAAAMLAAVSLSTPAWSATDAPDPASDVVETAQAKVPMPKVRPVRKRVASAAPVRRWSAPSAYPWFAPYPQQVAVHWPILMLGIGY